MRLIDADRLLDKRMQGKYYHLPNGDVAIPIIDIEHAPTVEVEITYEEISNVLLLLWMDNILTDGEYDRIMDKVNAEMIHSTRPTR